MPKEYKKEINQNIQNIKRKTQNIINEELIIMVIT